MGCCGTDGIKRITGRCSIQAFVTQHLAERAFKTIASQRFDSTVELLEAGFVQVVVMVAVAALSLLSAVALLLMAMDGRNVRSVSALWRSGQLVRVRSSSLQPGSAWQRGLPARAPPLDPRLSCSRLGVHPRE